MTKQLSCLYQAVLQDSTKTKVEKKAPSCLDNQLAENYSKIWYLFQVNELLHGRLAASLHKSYMGNMCAQFNYSEPWTNKQES